jgi:hypothetical protein
LAFVARGFLAAGLAGELSAEPLARLRALGLVAFDASFDALFRARACFGACASDFFLARAASSSGVSDNR